MTEEGLDNTVLGLIVPSIYEECTGIDIVEFINDRPGLEGANDVEL